MATYTATEAKTITLVNGQGDTIVLTGTGTKIGFAITANKQHIYVKFAGPGQTIADPTVGGDNCFCVDHQTMIQLPWGGSPVTLKLICSGTPTVTVMLYS